MKKKYIYVFVLLLFELQSLIGKNIFCISGKRLLRQRSVSPRPSASRRLLTGRRPSLDPPDTSIHVQLGHQQAVLPRGEPLHRRARPQLQRPQPVHVPVPAGPVSGLGQRLPRAAVHSQYGNAADARLHGPAAGRGEETGWRCGARVVQVGALGHCRAVDCC